ncbi:hypothetical protein ACFQ7P_33970, partial [Streptomyces erythrochromogenes]
MMLTAVIVTAAVLGVAKVVRDWLILRQVRAAMEAGTPEDRVRIGMRLAEALGGGQSAAGGGGGPGAPGRGGGAPPPKKGEG